MPFVVQAHTDDHALSVATETAKEAFAKAVEWHAVYMFTGVCISDGIKSYTFAEFSSAMPLLKIASTAETPFKWG